MGPQLSLWVSQHITMTGPGIVAVELPRPDEFVGRASNSSAPTSEGRSRGSLLATRGKASTTASGCAACPGHSHCSDSRCTAWPSFMLIAGGRLTGITALEDPEAVVWAGGGG